MFKSIMAMKVGPILSHLFVSYSGVQGSGWASSWLVLPAPSPGEGNGARRGWEGWDGCPPIRPMGRRSGDAGSPPSPPGTWATLHPCSVNITNCDFAPHMLFQHTVSGMFLKSFGDDIFTQHFKRLRISLIFKLKMSIGVTANSLDSSLNETEHRRNTIQFHNKKEK